MQSDLQEKLTHARKAFDKAVANKSSDIAQLGKLYLALLDQQSQEISESHPGAVPGVTPLPSSSWEAVHETQKDATVQIEQVSSEQKRVRAILQQHSNEA